jgi:hypothetical protein
MDSQTVPNPFAPAEQRARMIKITLLGLAFAVTCVLFGAAFTWFEPDQLSLSDRYFPASTLTSTPTATFTPTPNLSATQRASQTTSTAVALQAKATSAASAWHETFSESFDNNDNNWSVDTQENEYSKITFEIREGKYRWTALARQGFIHWVSLPAPSVDDLSLSVEVNLGDYTGLNDYGIIFRKDRAENFYYFGIDTEQMYSLFKYYNQEWIVLIDRTSTSLIRNGQPNQITVLAEGSHMMLFINGHFVAEHYDDQIKNGTAALAVEIFEPDQQAIFEFDNVVLRIP